MDDHDRRQDIQTADQIAEALQMKRAFGADAALTFLQLRGIDVDLARNALVARNPRMFFEVYAKWLNGAASAREKAKLRALFVPTAIAPASVERSA